MEKLKPEQIMEHLQKNGRKVSIEEASQILNFLRMLANIITKRYLQHYENPN
ncbi:hypothetical protein [Solitalea lacus]|uniref:hypothetical protein n=1 Tax=Solitalea lacus TaxID=2911172 RepID=UPI001EDC259D|nr:hypothetical protein [Solitalea lacus]UKJ07900.1 hypothetical protein L2B55_01750 [Solitalea lacus]